MLTRYQSAQNLMQGILTKVSAFNTTLIPHWIGNSDCFWCEREFKNGKEFRLVNASVSKNKVAFDHAALAKSLAHVAGQTINTENLPIRKIEICLLSLRITFDALGKRWIFNTPPDSEDSTNTC